MSSSVHPVLKARLNLAAELESGTRLLLVLDFDGTLTPIVRRPEAARLNPGVRRTLERLIAHPRIHLTILSGRSLPDLRRRMRLTRVIYGGCHGLEIRGPGLRVGPRRAASLARQMRRAAAALDAIRSRFPGTFLERKRYGLAVHYRGLMPSRVRDLRAETRRVASQAGLGILPGKKVWDLVRPGHRGKAVAVRLIRSHLARRWSDRRLLTVCVGDDVTDTDACRSMRGRTLTIRVGGIRGPADYRLAGVRDVHALLRWLARTAEVFDGRGSASTGSDGRAARGSPGGGG